MLAYYLLVSTGNTIEYGEALDLLKEKLCITPKIGKNMLKKLRNSGYISIVNRGDKIIIKTQSLEKVFSALISKYSDSRCKKLGVT